MNATESPSPEPAPWYTSFVVEEIQASEKKYIEAYLKHPFATDWRYFWGTIGNILFKHKRSH